MAKPHVIDIVKEYAELKEAVLIIRQFRSKKSNLSRTPAAADSEVQENSYGHQQRV